MRVKLWWLIGTLLLLMASVACQPQAAIPQVALPTNAPVMIETMHVEPTVPPSPEPSQGGVDMGQDLFFEQPEGTPENVRIIINKSARRLELYSGDILLGRFRIGLGGAPVGAKSREGDQKTPEGEYYLCTRNENSRFYKSLGLSYPNTADAQKGLDDGVITQAQYNQIDTAIEGNDTPDWYTALGGEIMIHGNGGTSDWTAGCIALDNEDMDILMQYAPYKTPVTINP